MMVTTASTRTPENVYEVGATVEYSCNVGSLLIGPATRTCLDTGFYNEFPPVCKSKEYDCYTTVLRRNHCERDLQYNALIVLGIECGYPASIKHGGYTLINNTVNYLSQVHYSCDEGYEMTGKDYRVDRNSISLNNVYCI